MPRWLVTIFTESAASASGAGPGRPRRATRTQSRNGEKWFCRLQMLKQLLALVFLDIYLAICDLPDNRSNHTKLLHGSDVIDGWSIERLKDVSLARKAHSEKVFRRGDRFKTAMQAISARWRSDYVKCDNDMHSGHEESLNSSNNICTGNRPQVPRKRPGCLPRLCRCPWFEIETPGKGAYQSENFTLLRYSSGGWSKNRCYPKQNESTTASAAEQFFSCRGASAFCEFYGPLHVEAAARKHSVFPLELAEEWQGEDVITVLLLPPQQGKLPHIPCNSGSCSGHRPSTVAPVSLVSRSR